ncbi:MAG: NOB1 family endonuclease [Thermoplasmata archaeon]
MKIVVDTSSLFYGFQIDGSNEFITTPSVIEEVRGRKMKKSVVMSIELLKIMEPSAIGMEDVERVARSTGDLDQLSRTDIELIALAKETEARLLTNDLAIQNVCRRMGIAYQSFKGKSINTEIEWGYRCIGCGRKFDRFYKECPYCGNELKKYPKKRKAIT